MGNKDLAAYLYIGIIMAIIALFAPEIDWSVRIISWIAIIVSGAFVYNHFKDKVPKTKSAIPDVSLHYPFIITDDNYHKYVPKWVTNNRTFQAYPLSRQVITYCVRAKGVDSAIPYPDEKTMKVALFPFHFNEKPATFQDLEIILKDDRHSLLFSPNPFSKEEMDNLHVRANAHIFDHLELVFIHSVQNCTNPRKAKNFPTNRRILIDHEKRVARPPPYGDLWIWQAGVLKSNRYRKRLPCTLGIWCFFYQFWKKPLKPIRYRGKESDRWDISELLGEEKVLKALSIDSVFKP